MPKGLPSPFSSGKPGVLYSSSLYAPSPREFPTVFFPSSLSLCVFFPPHPMLATHNLIIERKKKKNLRRPSDARALQLLCDFFLFSLFFFSRENLFFARTSSVPFVQSSPVFKYGGCKEFCFPPPLVNFSSSFCFFYHPFFTLQKVWGVPSENKNPLFPTPQNSRGEKRSGGGFYIFKKHFPFCFFSAPGVYLLPPNPPPPFFSSKLVFNGLYAAPSSPQCPFFSPIPVSSLSFIPAPKKGHTPFSCFLLGPFPPPLSL